MTGSSTFRIKCGDDGFHHDSLDVPHQTSTGDLHRARTKVPRVSFTGDSFVSKSSVLTKWIFSEMPNSRSCNEFSERLQIVVFTLGIPELNAVYNAIADVLQKPRVLEVMARGWESLNVQFVLFTLGDPELNVVYNTTEGVLQVLR